MQLQSIKNFEEYTTLLSDLKTIATEKFVLSKNDMVYFQKYHLKYWKIGYLLSKLCEGKLVDNSIGYSITHKFNPSIGQLRLIEKMFPEAQIAISFRVLKETLGMSPVALISIPLKYKVQVTQIN